MIKPRRWVVGVAVREPLQLRDAALPYALVLQLGLGPGWKRIVSGHIHLLAETRREHP